MYIIVIDDFLSENTRRSSLNNHNLDEFKFINMKIGGLTLPDTAVKIKKTGFTTIV